MRTRALGVAAGILLLLALAPPAASAQPAPPPPADPPFVSELLARGAAGEFRVSDTSSGVLLRARKPTDLVLVKVTLKPGRETGWHEHAGPSMGIMTSGSLIMRQPRHAHHTPKGDGGNGCTAETFVPGQAFAHPAHVHNFINETADPTEFYIAYFVPEGASPAPIPADPPAGCEP